MRALCSEIFVGDAISLKRTLASAHVHTLATLNPSYVDVLPMLAADAMKQTRLLVNNPRPLQEADALAIYREAH